jgi:uracil-DNA glycosylase family 4
MDENLCVTDCTKCSKLVESRNQIVNGVGPKNADLVLVGEAPGENEDKNGKPFVGRSGDVLDEVLENHGLNRNDIRITNTVRCRPPDNRDPHKSEITNCNQYLINEIAEVNPEAVLTLGRVPTETLIDDNISVTEIAGQKYERNFNGTNIVVIAGIHPAATLYDSSYRDLFNKSIKTAVEEISCID